MEQRKTYIYITKTNSSIVLQQEAIKPGESNPNALKWQAGNVNQSSKPAYWEE